MTDLDTRIVQVLHASETPLDMVDLTILLKEDVGDALLELKRTGRVHENHKHRFRLTNEERTRLKEAQKPSPEVTITSIDSSTQTPAPVHLPVLEFPVVLRTAFQPKCRHCTDWTRLLPDTTNDPEGGWCEKFSDYRAHDESHECHSELPLEPTNAELDAIEAEESESSTPIGFAGATVELLSDSEADAMAEQWDVECAAKDRPTNGLRIEAVARELVEVESRRQELIEELGRLVG